MTSRSRYRRLLRALALMGNPKIHAKGVWLFLILNLVFCLYHLGPVFVYFIRGIPPEESLEVITGVWREEGKLGSNRNGLVAPKYFVDTEQGPREVHCGFPLQRRRCSIYYGLPPDLGMRVTVFYDNYFGILAFKAIDVPYESRTKANMSYTQGITRYAKSEYITYKNGGAHWILLFLLVFYAFLAMTCWFASKSETEANK